MIELVKTSKNTNIYTQLNQFKLHFISYLCWELFVIYILKYPLVKELRIMLQNKYDGITKKKETKDYALSVSLLDGELAFTIRDYVSGLDYKKTYSEDDNDNNSKQINKNIRLSDIYLNFADN